MSQPVDRTPDDNPPPNPAERLRLFAAAVEEKLDDADARQLAKLLSASADARREYLDHVDAHARLLMHFEHAPAVAEGPFPKSLAARDWLRRAYEELSRPTPLSIAVAALVVGVLITTAAFVAAPFYRQITGGRDLHSVAPPELVAEITGAHDAIWAAGQIGTHRGAHLTAGREMNLEAGLVEIEFRRGAKVVIEGPCRFCLQTAGSGELKQGKLVAYVPPQAVGFAVQTPLATIVDLGTEFGLHVSDGDVVTHVFRGEVELRANSSAGVRIKAGQSVRVDGQGVSRSELVDVEKRFNRRTGFTNLAAGKPIIAASGSWPGLPHVDQRYLPDHVVDGRISDSLGAYWLGRDETPDEHFTVDLRGNYHLERVEIIPTHNGAVGDRGTKDYEIWGASEVDEFQQLIAPRKLAAGTLPLAKPGSILPVLVLSEDALSPAEGDLRYVKFVAVSYYGVGSGLNELRLFGPAAEQRKPK